MTERRYQVRQRRPRSAWVSLLIPFLAILITAGVFSVAADRLTGQGAPFGQETTPSSTPTVATTSTPTPEPPTPTPLPTPTPEPPTPTPLPPLAVLQVGTEATVNAESGLRVRSGPGTSFDPVTTLAAGVIVKIIDGPQRADTYNWWKIQFDTEGGGQGDGWVAGDFLDPGAG
ncbi:MAG: SH3 domain-containing protein [Chloroflexi bacterium]|nr:SH3 domain-containing protein [Chloroflexota bacterium]